MIDWTKPIEAVHVDGRVVPVEIDPDYKSNQKQGRYTLLDVPDYDAYFTYNTDGTCWDDDSDWSIRNCAEPANDELAELRAFKEAAIAKYPDLGPVDPDVLQARKIALKFALPAQISGMTSHRTNQGEFDDTDVMAAICEAMDWARANPR